MADCLVQAAPLEVEMIADELRTLMERILVSAKHPKVEDLYAVLALADRVAELESRPCPHVRTSGTTSHCTLAERDARDAERYQRVKAKTRHHSPHMDGTWHWSLPLLGRSNSLDNAVDALPAVIKEQADADR